MNTERLLFLAKKLRENADNPQGTKFDLTAWLRNDTIPKVLDCGTTACAFGFAALLPEFNAQGLTMDPVTFTPKFKRPGSRVADYSFGAAAAFFEIDRDTAHELFNDAYYSQEHLKGAKGERRVADKIEALCADKPIRDIH